MRNVIKGYEDKPDNKNNCEINKNDESFISIENIKIVKI